MIAVFFTQKTQNGIKVIDDLNRNYGTFENIDEAKEKIKRLYNVMGEE